MKKMKLKKLLSFLLCCVMVFGLMPLTAFAAVPGITITNFTENSFGTGWSYVKGTKTLTLNGYNGDYIRAKDVDELNLVLQDGSNNIINTSDDISYVRGIYCSGNLNISGSGSLTINVSGSEGGAGIYCYAGKITVESDANVTVNITNNGKTAMDGILSCGENNSVANNGNIQLEGIVNITCPKNNTGDVYGIANGGKDGVISISGGSVTVNDADIGIRGGAGSHDVAFANIIISGGEVNITSKEDLSQGIYSGGNGVEISGGTVTVSTDSYALRLFDQFYGYRTGLVKITGSAKVSLTSNTWEALRVEFDKETTSTRVHEIDLSSGGSFTVQSYDNRPGEDYVSYPVRGYFKLGSNTGFVKGSFSYSTNAGGGKLFEADATAKLVEVAYKTGVPTTYTVSFDANGGTGTMDDVTVESGSYTLPENSFTEPEGKQFKGWATSADGTIISGKTIAVTADTTLYAIWEDIPATTYNLTTQVNGRHGTISAGKTGLTAGSTETVIFTPDAGYEIDTVTVNGVVTSVLSNMLNVTMDADKTVIVTYKEISHTHSFGDWQSDSTHHWKKCKECNYETEKVAHTFKWVIDKEATAAEKGSKHEECEFCGYKKAAVEIPATGSSGGDNPGRVPVRDTATIIIGGEKEESKPVEENPNTGAPVAASLSTISVLTLAAAAAVLKMKKR